MMPLQSLYTDATFRLSGLTWLGGLDLLLVAVAFFLLLNLLQRSRAGFLLRGTLALSTMLLIVTIILPLPTFDWLMQVSLIAILIGTPIIFQPELRRLLEQLGRSTGMGRVVRQTAAEKVLSELVQAVENLSANRTGALIAIEGRDSLQSVSETGVRSGGQVTSELLQSIFYPGTPLHDGAVILREDQVLAAGCVLPLTQESLQAERRLGTRHRAAVGLSENYDALVVVVSEETGEISVAHRGQLWHPLDSATLRQQILNFYVPSTSGPSPLSSWNLISQAPQQLWQNFSWPTSRQLFSNIGLLFVALLLALATWSFVIEQTDPAERFRVDNIPLRVADMPPGNTLVTPPPTSVSAIVQTTANMRPTLRPGSFQAIMSLKGLSSGLHHLPIQINTGASQVRVLEVDPPVLDLELAEMISRTLPVTVDLPDQQNLSPAYKIVGNVIASPSQVQIIGAAPLVEQVSQIQTTISLANAGASLQEIRPVRALDQEGNEVTGVSLEPAQVKINIAIQQRPNAREMGIQVVPGGPPPVGYWLSGLSVTPASVTLQGNPDRLAKMGSFVNTLPVAMSQAIDDLTVRIPLDLPPDVQALDSQGNVVRTVTATAQITARTGDIIVTRSVQSFGVTPEITVTIDPPEIEMLLTGPLPLLNELKADSRLLQVQVPVNELLVGQSANLTPTVFAPKGIQVQLIPPSVLVTLHDKTLPYAQYDKPDSDPGQ